MIQMQHVQTLMAVSFVPATLDFLVMENCVQVYALNGVNIVHMTEVLIIHHCHFSTDIDECTTGMDSCNESADCVNTEGSYECMCIGGYSGDGFSCESES